MALKRFTAAQIARGVADGAGVQIAAATAVEICIAVLRAVALRSGVSLEDSERAHNETVADLLEDILVTDRAT
jgi:hypothetical protein